MLVGGSQDESHSDVAIGRSVLVAVPYLRVASAFLFRHVSFFIEVNSRGNFFFLSVNNHGGRIE